MTKPFLYICERLYHATDAERALESNTVLHCDRCGRHVITGRESIHKARKYITTAPIEISCVECASKELADAATEIGTLPAQVPDLLNDVRRAKARQAENN